MFQELQGGSGGSGGNLTLDVIRGAVDSGTSFSYTSTKSGKAFIISTRNDYQDFKLNGTAIPITSLGGLDGNSDLFDIKVGDVVTCTCYTSGTFSLFLNILS